MCWIDIQEYKAIPTEDYRHSKFLHIYHKYIKYGAVLEIGGIETFDREAIEYAVEESKNSHSVLTASIFDKIQTHCFYEIYHNIFCIFKSTDLYIELTKKIKKKFNNVRVEDFEYMKKLGEGGFGIVVQCKKKSTGKEYAMKIQTKSNLLNSFADDPRRVDCEKKVLATCQHPFIVNLDYAFQTPTLVIMVMELASAGDLRQAQSQCPGGLLPPERVRFYAAEILLALSYLHQLGLIYRDLKPHNVLLNASGHVQLTDMGGVLDQSGRVCGLRPDAEDPFVALFSQQLFDTTSCDPGAGPLVDPETASAPRRRMSVMGTCGFMAPEMVICRSAGRKEGYDKAIDFWSLGITLFMLLTNDRPFRDDNFCEFIEKVPAFTLLHRAGCNTLPEYAALFQQIRFPPHVPEAARDFISQLLDVNSDRRLGSDGVRRVKEHPYFESVNWELMEQKHMEPPYVPEARQQAAQRLADFEDMMAACGKTDWLDDEIEEQEQQHFFPWDFISPQTLRIEFGLATEMAQYDRSFKVRQLMGAKDDKKGKSGRRDSKALRRDSMSALKTLLEPMTP